MPTPDGIARTIATSSDLPVGDEKPGSLRREGLHALLWSLVQTWGSRFLSMLAFLALARFLTPEQFGLASSAILVFSIVGLVSELGVGDTVIRHRDLADRSLNTLFLAALGASLLLSVSMAMLSGWLERKLGAPGLAPFVVCTAMLAPVSVAAGFQEAVLKRDLAFRRVASRALISGAAGGIVGVILALGGYGAWAIMGTFGTQIVVGAACLWLRPAWQPGLRFDRLAFRAIGSFGARLMGMRSVDFATMRTVDILVLTQLGTASFGLFAVSWRLYQFLMQLFQAALGGASLTMLARIQDDRPRLGRLYVRALSISAFLAAPPFLLVAALAPELTHLLLGAQWIGAEPIMSAFLVVGAIHCVIFCSGSFLTTLGRPGTLLGLMLLKAALVLAPLWVLGSDDPASMARIIAAGLIAEAPFTIHATLRALQMSWTALVRPVLLPLLASALATVAVTVFRQTAMAPTDAGLGMLLSGCALFLAVYAVLIALTSLAAMRANVAFVAQTLRPERTNARRSPGTPNGDQASGE